MGWSGRSMGMELLGKLSGGAVSLTWGGAIGLCVFTHLINR